ncbi:Tn3 family transposase, partial [Klebsiella pneumoniae]|nr:Tn3 family transposase [Klebsiella pneumoniae]
ITPLDAAVPDRAQALIDQTSQLLPRIKITELLMDVDDLRIEEHYTDTAGFTDHVFALMHLLGFRFAPRIRDLG